MAAVGNSCSRVERPGWSWECGRPWIPPGRDIKMSVRQKQAKLSKNMLVKS